MSWSAISIGACSRLEPDHLSVYNLTVEERTPFGAMKRDGLLAFPEDGVAAEMYEIVIERLTRAGYSHYEVSSFAKEGRAAVHNTLYWKTGGEYLGLGLLGRTRIARAEAGGRSMACAFPTSVPSTNTSTTESQPQAS